MLNVRSLSLKGIKGDTAMAISRVRVTYGIEEGPIERLNVTIWVGTLVYLIVTDAYSRKFGYRKGFDTLLAQTVN
jgi:hypothetical protein